MTWEDVCALGAHLPGIARSTYYGYPALKVAGKFVAGCKDGENLVLPVDQQSRAILLKAEPEIFHVTDHYRDSAAVLVRLAVVERSRLRALLEIAWETVAPRDLLEEFRREPS